MSETEFEPGDVVVLKGHYIKMTVEVRLGQWLACVWYDATQKIQRDKFLNTTLRKVNG